jgi:hypothetical protein
MLLVRFYWPIHLGLTVVLSAAVFVATTCYLHTVSPTHAWLMQVALWFPSLLCAVGYAMTRPTLGRTEQAAFMSRLLSSIFIKFFVSLFLMGGIVWQFGKSVIYFYLIYFIAYLIFTFLEVTSLLEALNHHKTSSKRAGVPDLGK